MNTRKFYAYCRVSSIKQKQDNTIENQIFEIKSYLKRHPEIIVEKFFKDDGISGFKEKNRAQFQQMLNDLAENEDIEGIICYDLSRIGRSALNLLQFIQKMDEIDKKIITISGMKIDTTTSTGKFMLTNYVAFLEYQANSIRERLQRGREIAIANGVVMGRKKIELNEKEIVRLYKLGLGCTNIAKIVGSSSTTVYRRLKKLAKDKKNGINIRGIYAK
ncbi:MAG: recombinase family protein [Candidatus Lokiarchaeota archaeon]|nr:recombinase family protein [Candidatus Harpocratesius repetitus]